MIKKLFLTILFTLVLSGGAFAQSLITIQKYLQDNVDFLDDPITLSYLMNRCSAAYVFASIITDKKMPETADKFTKAATDNYQFSVQVLIKELNYDFYKANKKTKQEIDTMLKYYQKDGEDFYARTGKYMENNYIGEDIQSCNFLYQSFNN